MSQTLWCGRRDSNPHTTEVTEPKSVESTNSTTPAYMSRCLAPAVFLLLFYALKSYTKVTTPKSRMSTNSITGAYKRQGDPPLFFYQICSLAQDAIISSLSFT